MLRLPRVPCFLVLCAAACSLSACGDSPTQGPVTVEEVVLPPVVRGGGSPAQARQELTERLGLGVAKGPVTREEVEAFLDFFESRGTRGMPVSETAMKAAPSRVVLVSQKLALVESLERGAPLSQIPEGMRPTQAEIEAIRPLLPRWERARAKRRPTGR